MGPVLGWALGSAWKAVICYCGFTCISFIYNCYYYFCFFTVHANWCIAISRLGGGKKRSMIAKISYKPGVNLLKRSVIVLIESKLDVKVSYRSDRGSLRLEKRCGLDNQPKSAHTCKGPHGGTHEIGLKNGTTQSCTYGSLGRNNSSDRWSLLGTTAKSIKS